MHLIIKQVGKILLESVAAIFILGIFVYIIFGGPLAEFMNYYSLWMYG